MSVSLMAAAWKSDLPTGQKMVLLAICDHANDSGECFPSVSMLMEKCSMSERSVFNHLAFLEKIGAIVRLSRSGRSNYYTVHPCKFCTPANSAPLQPLHPTPANFAPPPLQILHPTPATVAPITIKEPSIEPSSNQKGGFDVPAWVPVDAWNGYVEMRVKKKKPLTQRAFMLAINELQRIKDAGKDVGVALDQSTLNGWTGLFHPKDEVVRKGTGEGLKYKSTEYFDFHSKQRWWADAGFETVYDAVNAGCHHKNFNEFTQGERVTA